MADKAHCRAQIDKILSSHALHGSESLCKLLRYLVDQALEHPGVSPKEYQIATEVFGRPNDFDPHLDSTVRVQVGRLRAKLADYYGSEGATDQIVFDFPRGTYSLTFHERPAGAERSQGAALHESGLETSASPRRWFAAVLLLSVTLSAIVAVGADRFLTRRTAEARLKTEKPNVPMALQVFWRGFLTGPQKP